VDIEITTSAAYKAAETYEQFFVTGMFRYWTPIFLGMVNPQPGERVLDVACGTGVVARSAVPMVGAQGKVVGLDINPAMLEVACSQFSDHCAEIDWREGQAEALPFSGRSFDLVVCQQGLQFFKDRATAAYEMQRVLRPAGRVGIEVWQDLAQNRFFAAVFDAMAAVFQIPLAPLAAPYGFGDPNKLENLLRGAGFDHVEVNQVVSYVHFPHPERFVELTIKAASAVMPVFAKLDDGLKSDMLAKVNRQLAGLVQRHTTGDTLSFPMSANIAVARL
jgi:ubiquinone/menaquinone biosynthesis C-methylase UbiE